MEQHRVPETYWKQFSYQKGDTKKLSIYKKGNSFTSSTTVNSFTSESDIFNVAYLPEYPLLLEHAFRDIENNYQKILDKLNRKDSLSNKDKNDLISFLSSLLCRSKSTLDLVNEYKKANKERLIEEITITFEEKDLIAKVIDDSGFDNNVILGFFLIHTARIISKSFSFVILKSEENKYWLTTDNPVVWESNHNFNYLITPDTEFYLPLNDKYCLFLYHERSKSKNDISGRIDKKNNFYQCNTEEQNWIINKIIENDFEHLVCPLNLGRCDLTVH